MISPLVPLQVVKLLEKEPENALQPNMVTSSSVTSSTQMTSASEETTVQRAADDGSSGVKKTVTVQQETTQRVTTSTSEQVNKDKDAIKHNQGGQPERRLVTCIHLVAGWQKIHELKKHYMAEAFARVIKNSRPGCPYKLKLVTSNCLFMITFYAVLCILCRSK